MNVSPEQIPAARGLLRLEETELAQRTHVSVITVRRLEGADGSERFASATLEGI